MTSLKALVCGDRNWSNREVIRSWLLKLQDLGYDTILEGEANGADSIAREEAERIGMKVEKYPADWSRYGRAAGPIRNRRMLDRNPNLVLAFHNDISHSRGTADTVNEAKKRGIRVIIKEGGDKYGSRA